MDSREFGLMHDRELDRAIADHYDGEDQEEVEDDSQSRYVEGEI